MAFGTREDRAMVLSESFQLERSLAALRKPPRLQRAGDVNRRQVAVVRRGASGDMERLDPFVRSGFVTIRFQTSLRSSVIVVSMMDPYNVANRSLFTSP